MITSLIRNLDIMNHLIKLSGAEDFEAPDREFVGHRDILTRSMSRYHFVSPHVHGYTLDVGCGRGYGLDVVRSVSNSRIGADLSIDFLRDAHLHFPHTSFVRSGGDVLPFSSASFDTVISFEVIEHIDNDLAFLNELKRVAKRQAFIAISTPNRLVSSSQKGKLLNPFHVREYTAPEYYRLLSQVFSSVELYGQRERIDSDSSVNGLIDRIPISWKYLLPAHIQDLISVTLRPPLRLDECRFETEDLDRTHTLMALCRV
jgi:SAM-dependent methyltransferase